MDDFSKYNNEEFIYELFSDSHDNDLNYIFRGQFSQNITDSILALAEKNIEQVAETLKVRKRIYFILLECLQNITRYQPNKVSEIEESAIFVIQKRNNKYFVSSGNLIYNDKVEYVRSRLEIIISLDQDQLNHYYKEVLSNGAMTKEGGGGLGLIEMARKSGQKLMYEFKKIDETYSFFYYQISMESAAPANTPKLSAALSLDRVMGFHNGLMQKNILLIYSSIFLQETMLSVITVVGKQLNGSILFQKKIYNILVELFQNIIRHGKNPEKHIEGNPGIFFIVDRPDTYGLTCGNYIVNDNIKNLEERILLINSFDEKKLENFYSERLFNFDKINKFESGLGLIDMRIKSGNKLCYEIKKVNETYSFFILHVSVKK